MQGEAAAINKGKKERRQQPTQGEATAVREGKGERRQ